MAFRHISDIDERAISLLSIALASRPRRSIALDLTGESLTDDIKKLTGEALLAIEGGGEAIASVRTDLYTIDEKLKELNLALKSLRLPDVVLLAGCVVIFGNSLKGLDVSSNNIGPDGAQYIAQALLKW